MYINVRMPCMTNVVVTKKWLKHELHWFLFYGTFYTLYLAGGHFHRSTLILSNSQFVYDSHQLFLMCKHDSFHLLKWKYLVVTVKYLKKQRIYKLNKQLSV